MYEVSAKEVFKLKDISGAGLMDCKKALIESKGDVEKAKEALRLKGLALANKKASREAKEGQVFVNLSDDYKSISYVKLACETDFVARNDKFKNLGKLLLEKLLKLGKADFLKQNKESGSLRPLVVAAIQELGENIVVMDCEHLTRDNNLFYYYLHTNKKLLALLEVKASSNIIKSGSWLDVVKDLCMHLAANQVLALSEDKIPQKDLDAEINIAQKQEEKKPKDLQEKIIKGRITKFKREVTMFLQPFLKEPEKTVSQWLDGTNKKLSAEIELVSFAKVVFD